MFQSPGRGRKSMSGNSAFVDTNVFVYSIDEQDAVKHQKAKELIHQLVLEDRIIISTFVCRASY